ncbi:M23 family metallopeptidase, partial [Nocardioides aequoreus]|uniref:M23 family metallopeptidase n=1 Tax=Nocardioides aequoreus TaxID=397278 RepID=UPI0012F66D36
MPLSLVVAGRQHQFVASIPRSLALWFSVLMLILTGISPASAAEPPSWQLPFKQGQTWQANGPHDNFGTGSGVFNSIDFGPGAAIDRGVVSVAPGRVRFEKNCLMTIEHADGWVSKYTHLVNQQSQLNGKVMPAGTYLGEAAIQGCPGDFGTANHVHLSIWRNGAPVAVTGMRFGGYQVEASGPAYHGRWHSPDGTSRAVQGGLMSVPLTSTTSSSTELSGTSAPAMTVDKAGRLWMWGYAPNGKSRVRYKNPTTSI